MVCVKEVIGLLHTFMLGSFQAEFTMEPAQTCRLLESKLQETAPHQPKIPEWHEQASTGSPETLGIHL